MIQELASEKIIKIIVKEGNHQDAYFKDGPVPEPLCFYDDVISKVPIELNEMIAQFQSNVPQCLETLFRDGKIIPSNIPSFLSDAVKMKYVGEQVVDLDVDIYKLFDLLHKQSLQYLDSLDKNVIQKGRDCLISMLQLAPENTIALYNMACAESLLENIPDALHYLERAIDCGYRNLENMLKDKDLEKIRESESFQNLVRKLELLITPDLSATNIDINVPPQEDDVKDVSFVPPVIIEHDAIDETDDVKIDDVNHNLTDSYLDIRVKWDQQLKTLKDMGFLCDDEVLSLILDQVNGDLEEAMKVLLQNSDLKYFS
jgi:hypothetical protein